ncbi:hypothetical protein [Thetidibacter halocola]|uniref:Uncharacterized protein n=1 Tax=Thetidibacter halocola TaxID=2827239 RepID=A0A8J8BAA8_9RHOB|nr:hypothetical protein [Thetidibacter halocola]MBS0124998.1 hypothetical protein [Thetidibacter halocola]
MIESYARHQETATAPAPAGSSDYADGLPQDVARDGRAESGALDLRTLAVHFPGYEIVDPVTVALRPVTIAIPPDQNQGGTG